MLTCPVCGAVNPDASRFCNACGARLDGPAVGLPAERRVVTAVFCDLVGFAATSHDADPEDIDRMLSAYAAMARSQIEGHGGVVEKYVGDAVLGVFGVPIAHEDDPERAVRAALRIAEAAAGLRTIQGEPLRLRIGINTGEVLVRLGVAPGSGERFLAGDTINVASRIQSIAPEMGVVVGPATYASTKTRFDYTELPPAHLKGKAEPVPIFHARAPRARPSVDLARTRDSPFVGREVELALLTGLFDRTLATARPQLVLVTGEPGIGKSRLVAELAADLDDRAGFTVWRQGRCLPYGEGITFWPLAEIVRAHAGILESDPAPVSAEKLEDVLPVGDQRPWLRQRMLPLIGIEATSSADREELFTAWRRFFEHIAEQDPTVLVFEDLHWADDPLLDFLETLAQRASAVPLFIIGIARPELLERRPDFAAGVSDASRLPLDRLSEAETERLVASLLETPVVPSELRQPILERAGGNPLYAEECLRLLMDQDLLVRSGTRWHLREGAQAPLPDSIMALLAARLDTLPPQARSVIADAAVVGTVFWAGAIAHLGERDEAEVTAILQELARKGLVRAGRRTPVEGEVEFAFSHVLARDVAYGQLPRAERASRHVAAARWIESRAPERVEDVARHYVTALDLARAAGLTDLAVSLEGAAFRNLALAGERALGLDTTAALGYLAQALALAPPGSPERPRTLAILGEAAFQAGRLSEAAEALEEAVGALRGSGDVRAAARAMGALSDVLVRIGDPRRWTLPLEALALLEPLGPSPALVAALTEAASVDALQLRSEEAIRVAERALELAAELGLPTPARALGFRGMARASLGDPRGLDDFREAIRHATEAGLGREVALLHNNLGWNLLAFEGPAASLEVLRAGIAFARPRGLTEMHDALTHSMLDALVDAGRHEEVLALAAEDAPLAEASGDVLALVGILAAQARILPLRGESGRMADSVTRLETLSRELGDPDDIVLGLGSASLVRAGLGQRRNVAALLTEIEGYPRVRSTAYYPVFLPAIVRAALALGEISIAARLVSGFAPRSPYGEHAVVATAAAMAEARGDHRKAAAAYADAALRWSNFGVVPEEAFALLGQGRVLLRLGEAADGIGRLRQSLAIWSRLDAGARVAEVAGLIAAAGATSTGKASPLPP